MQKGNSCISDKNPRSKHDAKVAIVIVASAFGADAIRRLGHAAFAAIAADAGAAGFEVRRELFPDEAEARPDALRELGERVQPTAARLSRGSGWEVSSFGSSAMTRFLPWTLAS